MFIPISSLEIGAASFPFHVTCLLRKYKSSLCAALSKEVRGNSSKNELSVSRYQSSDKHHKKHEPEVTTSTQSLETETGFFFSFLFFQAAMYVRHR
jgi:hypothetical protein